MVVEEFLSFWDWLPGALVTFLLVSCLLVLLGIFFGYLVSAVRYGPSEGFYSLAQTIVAGIVDFAHISPRRVLAITRLVVRESVRRRVLLVAFALFALALLVGGWFLDVKSDHPDRLYIGFVWWGTQLLALLLVMLLSAFGLPNDIRFNTIYTVVTKPVRPVEIVLGRILGYGALGTALLAAMCVISYLFVVRGLSHRHQLTAADLLPATVSSDSAAGDVPPGTLEGYTTSNNHHRHKVTVTPDGKAYTDMVMGHTHQVTVEGEGETATFRLGPPEGMLQARVPIYATDLRFLDRTGATKERGVSVGNEWTYRSYIAGGTMATAIWTFEGIRPGVFPNDELPLEMTLSVYRSHKGNIERGVTGELVLKHPTRSIQTVPRVFVSHEYTTQRINIPRKLRGQDRSGRIREIDLFDDLVDDEGRLEIRIQCAEPGQYFGMARADLYLRAEDGWFAVNFFKGYLSIWLQMIVVLCVGVMFSTFLSSAVTLLGTIAVTIVGFHTQFIQELAAAKLPGGGPLEALVRILTQKNLMVELDPGLGTTLIKSFDAFVLQLMRLATYTVPDFRQFNTSDYVAYGFNIDGGLVCMHLLITLAFVVCLSVIAYFFLKTREIAA